MPGRRRGVAVLDSLETRPDDGECVARLRGRKVAVGCWESKDYYIF